jgi:biotin carboxyl carrier protein
VTLRVAVDGRWLDLEMARDGSECRFRVRDGDSHAAERTASLLEVEPAIYSVLLDGRSYEVRVEQGPAGSFVAVRGRRFAVEVTDPRRFSRATRARAAEGRVSIRAPMPGRVVRTLVAEGDRVQAGQGVAVVEAMKMQNEMQSPKAGHVISLRAREGSSVAAGEILAVIE